jgi:acetamidase/formamidase
LATYHIEPERRTLHGHYSRELVPVLHIESGDTVTFRTLDAGWGLESPKISGEARNKFRPRTEGLDDGHALCGPVFIRGAVPGCTLEVQVKGLTPALWGWTVAGGWSTAVNDRMGVAEGGDTWLYWELDPERGTGRDQHGRVVKLSPFMGVMGMPPDKPGIHPTAPPRVTGGNIDCKELVTGSRLYLPVAVEGGLFSVGDGHALQADGEVSSTAIECPMERVELTFVVHGDLRLKTPRAETPAGWISLGFDESLDEAMLLALEGMLEFIQEKYGMARGEALAYASLLVDMRITQVVNGVRGVHAVLPHGALD